MPSLFKSKQKTTQSQQFTNRQTPTELPEWGELGNLLRSSVTQRLQQGPGQFLRGYEETGIGRINRTFDTLRQAQENSLTRRGLAGSPIAGASDLGLNLGRGSQIADFQSRIPLLERDIGNQDLGMAMSLFGSRPLGQTASGRSSGQSETVQSPSIMSSIMPLLGMAAGLGAFQPLSGLFGQKSPSQYRMP